MDSKSISNAPTKKMKFVPKAPGRRPPKPPKTEVVDEAEDFEAQELLRRAYEGSTGRPRMERKSQPVRVAFGAGAAMPSGYYKNPKADPSRVKQEEYIEPWDYESSYVPTVLPLRKPYSGNPEVLDELEFGKAAETAGFDENRTNAAVDLGLMDESLEPRLLFLQLPKLMPMMKQSALPTRPEDASSSKPPNNAAPTERMCGFRELPAGQMGKLLVYKSGKVKLKLGDVLFDVNPGSNCVFAQDVVAVNKKDRTCCVVGQVEKRAVITPDINSILDSIADVDLV